MMQSSQIKQKFPFQLLQMIQSPPIQTLNEKHVEMAKPRVVYKKKWEVVIFSSVPFICTCKL